MAREDHEQIAKELTLVFAQRFALSANSQENAIKIGNAYKEILKAVVQANKEIDN